MALTRECFDPWHFKIIHAGGLICPCCAMNDADYGDFILDYVIPHSKGEETGDVLNNSALKALKKGLLTGNLRPMCQSCALVSPKLITTEEYTRKLEEKFRQWGFDYSDITDYSEVEVIRRAGIGLTNRCNLRCIYCNQSVLADKNPYFKMDFPSENMMDCLEMLVEKGVQLIETGVFGEVTLHPRWCEIFTDFHNKYPDIELSLTTNLSKKYTDAEIELLAEHKALRVSLETLDPELFAKIRKHGRLSLILENLDRIVKVIDAKGYNRSRVSISSVICNLTWQSITEVSRFAYQHGFNYHANNLELRPNSIGVHENLLKPIEALEPEEKEQVRQILERAKFDARKYNAVFHTNAGMMNRIQINYNSFEPYDNNPVYHKFFEKYKLGTQMMHLGIVYDYSNNQYEGIMMGRGQTLQLELNNTCSTLIVREISIYKKGYCSAKYDQRILPDYRKRIAVRNEFIYQPNFKEDNVEYVLLQVLEWWEEGE